MRNTLVRFNISLASDSCRSRNIESCCTALYIALPYVQDQIRSCCHRPHRMPAIADLILYPLWRDLVPALVTTHGWEPLMRCVAICAGSDPIMLPPATPATRRSGSDLVPMWRDPVTALVTTHGWEPLMRCVAICTGSDPIMLPPATPATRRSGSDLVPMWRDPVTALVTTHGWEPLMRCVAICTGSDPIMLPPATPATRRSGSDLVPMRRDLVTVLVTTHGWEPLMHNTLVKFNIFLASDPRRLVLEILNLTA